MNKVVLQVRKLSKVVGNLTKLGLKCAWKGGGGKGKVLRFVKIEAEIYEKLGMELRTHEQSFVRVLFEFLIFWKLQYEKVEERLSKSKCT